MLQNTTSPHFHALIQFERVVEKETIIFFERRVCGELKGGGGTMSSKTVSVASLWVL